MLRLGRTQQHTFATEELLLNQHSKRRRFLFRFFSFLIRPMSIWTEWLCDSSLGCNPIVYICTYKYLYYEIVELKTKFIAHCSYDLVMQTANVCTDSDTHTYKYTTAHTHEAKCSCDKCRTWKMFNRNWVSLVRHAYAFINSFRKMIVDISNSRICHHLRNENDMAHMKLNVPKFWEMFGDTTEIILSRNSL